MKKTKSIDRLPPELLGEIWKRLPVKTLLKLRFVCKTWNSIISNHDFAQLHLRRFYKKNIQDSKYLLSGEHRFQPLVNVRCSKTLKIVKRIDLGKFRNCIIRDIVCCVDGVLLIHISSPRFNYGSNVIFLLNPTIGKIVEIPPYESLKNSRNVNFGFGFDSVSNNYKVVAVNMKYYALKTKVYNLGTRTWTFPKGKRSSINDDVLHLSKLRHTVNIGGGIYWLAWVKKTGPEKLSHFLRFDLSSETFTCFNLPEFKCEPGLIHRWRRPSILHDSLALVDYCSGFGYGGHLRVWTRQKDSTKGIDSWVELYTLGIDGKNFIFLKSNGDVYLRSKEKVIVYNLRNKEVKGSLEIKGVIKFMDSYTESLVLLGQPNNKSFCISPS